MEKGNYSLLMDQLTHTDLIKIPNTIMSGELRDQKCIWCIYRKSGSRVEKELNAHLP